MKIPIPYFLDFSFHKAISKLQALLDTYYIEQCMCMYYSLDIAMLYKQRKATRVIKKMLAKLKPLLLFKQALPFHLLFLQTFSGCTFTFQWNKE